MDFLSQRVALVLFCLGLGACPRPESPRHVPDPDQREGLPDDPDALVALADRLVGTKPEALKRLDRARAALERALPRHRSRFDVHWRMSRVCALIAVHVRNKEQCVELTTEGVEHAERAEALAPGRVEPPYFHALNLARRAEVLRSLDLIKKAVTFGERAKKINASFDAAGPLLFLGKVYVTAPAWPVSVGDMEKGIALLERAVSQSPRPMSHLFLAQAYVADEQFDKAKPHLHEALKGSLDPRWRNEAEGALETCEAETR